MFENGLCLEFFKLLICACYLTEILSVLEQVSHPLSKKLFAVRSKQMFFYEESLDARLTWYESYDHSFFCVVGWSFRQHLMKVEFGFNSELWFLNFWIPFHLQNLPRHRRRCSFWWDLKKSTVCTNISDDYFLFKILKYAEGISNFSLHVWYHIDMSLDRTAKLHQTSFQ